MTPANDELAAFNEFSQALLLLGIDDFAVEAAGSGPGLIGFQPPSPSSSDMEVIVKGCLWGKRSRRSLSGGAARGRSEGGVRTELGCRNPPILPLSMILNSENRAARPMPPWSSSRNAERDPG